MAIDVEKIIKNVVDKNYPSDQFLYLVNNFSSLPANYQEGNENITDLKDGSGREYFMWGYSQWGGDDIIAE